MPRPVCPCPPPLQRLPGHPEFFPPIQRSSVSSSRPLQPSAPSGTPPLPHRVNQRSSNLTIRAAVYISFYVAVNTFNGGRQPQNKLMRLRTFKKKAFISVFVCCVLPVLFLFPSYTIVSMTLSARGLTHSGTEKSNLFRMTNIGATGDLQNVIFENELPNRHTPVGF